MGLALLVVPALRSTSSAGRELGKLCLVYKRRGIRGGQLGLISAKLKIKALRFGRRRLLP